MNIIIWDLFYQTGDIETYLLLKQIENEQLEDVLNRRLNKQQVIATMQTKL